MGTVSVIFPAAGNYGRIQSRTFCVGVFEFWDDLNLTALFNFLKGISVITSRVWEINHVKATVGGRSCFARAIFYIYLLRTYKILLPAK